MVKNKSEKDQPVRKIIPIPNVEKKLHEKWTRDRDWFNFPKPFRWAICGSPNAGKSTLLLNALIHSDPTWDRIFLLHPRTYAPESDDGSNNNVLLTDQTDGIVPEYKGVKVYHLAYIPTEIYWSDMKGNSLLIIDDIDLVSFTKKDASKQRRVNKLFSYCSTHNQLSIMVTSQSPSTQLPAIVLQLCNIVTLFPQKDSYKIRTLALKLGLEYKQLKAHLNLLKGVHDTISYDNTLNSPAEVRLNIYDKVN